MPLRCIRPTKFGLVIVTCVLFVLAILLSNARPKPSKVSITNTAHLFGDGSLDKRIIDRKELAFTDAPTKKPGGSSSVAEGSSGDGGAAHEVESSEQEKRRDTMVQRFQQMKDEILREKIELEKSKEKERKQRQEELREQERELDTRDNTLLKADHKTQHDTSNEVREELAVIEQEVSPNAVDGDDDKSKQSTKRIDKAILLTEKPAIKSNKHTTHPEITVNGARHILNSRPNHPTPHPTVPAGNHPTVPAGNYPRTRCRPVRNVVFSKTHKTGSSTVLNILLRYADKRNLSVALPTPLFHLGWPKRFENKFVFEHSPGKKYNILTHHSRFNKKKMKKLMDGPTKFVTIVRDPLYQFESSATYFKFGKYLKLDPNVSIFKTFFNTSAKQIRTAWTRFPFGPMNLVKNPNVFDFGHVIWNETRPAREAVMDTVSNFNLVMVMDYMAESLLLLKDELCWSLEDIAYFTMNKRPDKFRQVPPPDARDKVRSWSSLDYQIFEAANKTFWKRIKDAGPRFQEDLAKLKLLNAQLQKECLADKMVRDKSQPWFHIEGYALRNPDPTASNFPRCSAMVRSEIEFTNRLKRKQTRTGWTQKKQQKKMELNKKMELKKKKKQKPNKKQQKQNKKQQKTKRAIQNAKKNAKQNAKKNAKQKAKINAGKKQGKKKVIKIKPNGKNPKGARRNI